MNVMGGVAPVTILAKSGDISVVAGSGAMVYTRIQKP
jgi:hypothetical protein